MVSDIQKEIVQRIYRNFLDFQILKLIEIKPMWGYKILNEIKRRYGIKIRHGALYPLLNSLESNKFLKSKKSVKKGRIRKIYEITSKGTKIIEIYHKTLEQQLKMKDLYSE